MKEKFKSFLDNDQIFYGSIVLVVGVLSFVLGQQTVTSTNIAGSNVQMIEPIVIENAVPITANEPKSITNPPELPKTTLVGSKNGSKYHLLTCPGAKQIKPENIVTFDSIQAAEAAGYSRAGNCPEL